MRQEDKYVYQVYCERSFSKAAQKLFVTQPALSLAIQRVEQQIEMPLFDRSSRPLTLTAAGEVYIEALEKEMRLKEDMYKQLSDIRGQHTGNIRLGGSHYINAYILPEILSGFQREYPGVRIELHEHDSVSLAQMLTGNNLDITFSCNAAFVDEFDHFPAFYDHILLAVPKTWAINEEFRDVGLSAKEVESGLHLQADYPVVSLSRFKELPFILLKEGNNLYDRCQRIFLDAGFEPKVSMKISQLVTAYRMAEHQIGATFVSDRLIRYYNDGLCYYKLAHPEATRLFYLLTPKNVYVSHATKNFAAYVRRHMAIE